MPVFDFDEESFATDFRSCNVEDNDPLQEIDGLEEEFEPPQSYEVEDSGNFTQARNIHRRRSSVYSRLSIKSGGVGSYGGGSHSQGQGHSHGSYTNELKIPMNYDNSKHKLKKLLSDFKPLRVLGQGAYGKVYLVQDTSTGKLFAQKQLRKPTINITNQPEDFHAKHIARTISEREILTNITHHPNIVKLFYALQDHDKFYLILEYIPGGELFHHLTSSKNSLGNVFKEDHVAFYAAQMALALKHLHELGIVYRDLKPENCLLNSFGNLVLTDFGLSKSIGEDQEDESCTSIIGTPEYMAPEVLKGEEYDFKVDWWSLGCVVYDMMSGKPPFTGNSHKAIQDKIIKNKLKLPYYFTMDAKDILNKLLNKNPEKRMSVDSQWETFKQHRFFRKIDWKSLENQQATPPLVPVITDPSLAENFLEEFTGMKLSLNEGLDIPKTFNSANDEFKGFSYTASESFISKYID